MLLYCHFWLGLWMLWLVVWIVIGAGSAVRKVMGREDGAMVFWGKFNDIMDL